MALYRNQEPLWPVKYTRSKAAPAAPKEKRPPLLSDFIYSRSPGGGCSSQLLTNFSLVGFGAAMYGPREEVDWTLPLPEAFIEGVRNALDKRDGGWSEAYNLMAVLPVMNSATRKFRQTHYDHFVVVEHILERTGWLRGACGRGQHGYPVQVWSRPSGGVQLDYAKEQLK